MSRYNYYQEKKGPKRVEKQPIPEGWGLGKVILLPVKIRSRYSPSLIRQQGFQLG